MSAPAMQEEAGLIEWNRYCGNLRGPARQWGEAEKDRRLRVRNKSRSTARECVYSLFGQTFDEPVTDRHKNDQNNKHDHTPGTRVPERVSIPCLLVDIRGQD